MEYEQRKPVNRNKREARRTRERKKINREEEANRQRSKGGGQTNELGVVQGQNGEQGNTTEPRNAQPIGRPGEK